MTMLADRYDEAVSALETAISNANAALEEKDKSGAPVVRREAIQSAAAVLRGALDVLKESPGDQLRELGI
jgi:hypothetical protein